jgi:hypothetical protein
MGVVSNKDLSDEQGWARREIERIKTDRQLWPPWLRQQSEESIRRRYRAKVDPGQVSPVCAQENPGPDMPDSGVENG